MEIVNVTGSVYTSLYSYIHR